MSVALRSTLLLSLVGATLSFLPASAEAARSDHLRVDVGAGMGVDYGMAGAMGGIDLRIWRGMGLSANVGVGAGLGGSAYLWSPGRRVRGGMGASIWRSWNTWGPEPCHPSNPPGYAAPGPDGPPGPCIEATPDGMFAASLQAALDHDFGEPSGWAIRYGLGLGVVASGGAGAVMPAPSVGLRYAF
jgi:hypothetical protein